MVLMVNLGAKICSRGYKGNVLKGLGIFLVVALCSATFFSTTGVFMEFRSDMSALDTDI